MTILLTVCCASYIFGIIAAPLISPTYLIIFMLFAFTATGASRLVLRSKVMLFIIAALMFFTGVMRYGLIPENTLYNKFPEKYVTVSANICSLPEHSTSQRKFRYEAELISISYLKTTYKASGRILINTDTELKFGDTFSASGFLTEFSAASNEFATDFKQFYRCRGILARLSASECVKTGEKVSLSPRLLAGRLKYRIYKNMEGSLSQEDFALACAVLFGDRSHFDGKYRTLTVRTGVSRIIYSCFTHISLLLMLISLLSRKRRRRDLYFIVAAILYLLFINSSAIALKAFITAILVISARRFYGFFDRFEIFIFTVFTMTLFDPLLCFDGGFMTSVFTTAILLLSYSPIYRRLSANRTVRRLRLAAPLTLWIILVFGTMPFAAYYFNGASVYSVLLIPLLLPFIACIIITSPILFIFGGAYNALYPIKVIFRAAALIVRYAPYAVSKLPYYYIFLPTPPVTFIIFYCLLWWIMLRALKSEFNTPPTKCIASAAAGMLLCLLMGVSINSLNIYFVNVGQGDAAILHTDIGETVIIDGGGSGDNESYNIGDNIFLPYLTSHGFTHIDAAIVSHYHKDHVEGIISAVENLKVNTLILPDCMPNNIYRKTLERLARDNGIRTEYLHMGDKIRFRSGLTLTVIAPDPQIIDKDNENNTSLVIDVRFGDFTALFTGDFEAEEELTPPANIDLLKVSHHGSENGSSKEFIYAVSPRIAVISVGKNNRYGLPDSRVIEDLTASGACVLRTDMLCDIKIKTDKKSNIKYSSLLGGSKNAEKRR